jgi:hypothetical protein
MAGLGQEWPGLARDLVVTFSPKARPGEPCQVRARLGPARQGA